MQLFRRLLVGLLAMHVVLRIAGAAPAAAAENLIESFDVSDDGTILLIPVSIGGKTYNFVLDTGTTVTTFDVTLKEFLEPLDRHAVYQGRRIPLYRCPGASFRGSRLHFGETVSCRDLSRMNEGGGGDVRGILGMNTLRNFAIQINIGEGKVLFLRSSKGCPGEKIPLSINKYHLPTIGVALPGFGEIPFVIDTGDVGPFFDARLEPKLFHFVEESGDLELLGETTTTVSLDGAAEHPVGYLASIAVGKDKLLNQRVAESSISTLALGTVARYNVTFDFQNRFVLLEKGRHFHRRLLPDRTGVRFEMKGSQCVVRDADLGSWGYEAGIRVGDRIVAFDGKSTVGTPRDSLRSHLYFAQQEELHVSVIDLAKDGGRNISLTTRRGQTKGSGLNGTNGIQNRLGH